MKQIKIQFDPINFIFFLLQCYWLSQGVQIAIIFIFFYILIFVMRFMRNNHILQEGYNPFEMSEDFEEENE